MSLVRWSDARAIFGLVNEVRLLGANPLAWRRHWVEGLLRLAGAQVGLGAEAPAGDLLDAPHHSGSLDLGWERDSDRRVWMSACERTEGDLDPSDPSIASLRRRSFARARHQLVDSHRWSRSKMANDHYRPAGLGDYLLSAVWLPASDTSHFVLLMKPTGETFSPRARELVDHAQRELGALWPSTKQPSLPRRLRQTLELLEAGLSEKELADRLGLSAHTVRGYCKDLHRHFGVHSRGELLASARARPRPPVLASEG